MDDLVKWLREVAVQMYVVGMGRCEEAADRIEAMEASLRWMIDIKVDETNAEDCVKFMQEEARHALGEKKDA